LLEDTLRVVGIITVFSPPEKGSFRVFARFQIKFGSQAIDKNCRSERERDR
jgi:hypothetical protein